MFFRCSQFFFKTHLHFLFLNICIFCFGGARSLLWCVGFIVVARGLSCPKACGVLSPGPGMEPASSALEGRFLTTGPPRKMSLTYILVQNISTLVWQQNGLNYLSSNNFFLKNLSEYWPPVARGASFRRWGTASHRAPVARTEHAPGCPPVLRPQTPTICWPTTDTQPRSMWYRGPGIPKSWHTSDGHTWNTHRGPPRACLPWGSLSFWSALLCTMAGYVMVSLLLCSFRTTDRPVLDMRTVVRRERKKTQQCKI